MCQICQIRCSCRHGRIPSKDQREAFCEFGRGNCPEPIVLVYQEMIKCDRCKEEDSDPTKPLAPVSPDLCVQDDGRREEGRDEEDESVSEGDEDFALADRALDRNPTGAASNAAKEYIATFRETFESIMDLIIELQSEHLENTQVCSRLQEERLRYSGWFQVLLNRATTASALEELLRTELRLSLQGDDSQTKFSISERLRNNHRISWAINTPKGTYYLMQKFLAMNKAVEKIRGELSTGPTRV